MRLFYLTLLSIIFIAGLFVALSSNALALDPYRSRCVGIQGTFTATNWSGGAIQVGCGGDDGLAVSDPAEKCTGEIQTIRPGQTFRLTKCSCFGSDKGCLKKGKELTFLPIDENGYKKVRVVSRIADMNVFINNSCSVNRTADVCGSNGQHITGNIRISCPTTPVSSAPTFTPVPPQSLVSPNPSICPVPDQVANVRIICPNCGDATQAEQPTN